MAGCLTGASDWGEYIIIIIIITTIIIILK